VGAGVANNAGWAVDDFDLEVNQGEAVTAVFPVFSRAVGDTDGYLLRVAYTVTVVGRYAPLSIIQWPPGHGRCPRWPARPGR
jgi:hypothetical protein